MFLTNRCDRRNENMRHRSKKTAARERACRPFCTQFRSDVDYCELCGNKFTSYGYRRFEQHEIAGGPLREKARDKRYAILGLCYDCHRRITNETGWPRARQLAILKRSRPTDYDLAAFNALVGFGKHRITEEDVDACST